MASSTLSFYKNNTQQVTFALVSTSENTAKWIVSGRALSVPFAISQSTKVNKGVSNDESKIIVSRTEANAVSGKLATALVEIRVSLPKDQTILTPTVLLELLSIAASALIDNAATGTTSANRTCMIEGRIL